jgi:hypothetical protein
MNAGPGTEVGSISMGGRVARLVVAVLAIAAIVVFVPGAPAAAEEGALVESTTRYVVDPSVPAVRVEATYTMTNQTPDSTLDDGRSEYFFFTGLYVPTELGATDIVVQVDGAEATYRREIDEEGYPFLDVDFGRELRFGQSATVTVTYTLLGDPPRTPGSVARVNAAYVSFPVYGWGDAGAVDVAVEVPAAWEVDYVGGDLERVEFGDTIVHEANGIDPDGYLVWFTARDDAALERTEIEVDGSRFDVLSWPGDEAWRDFTQAQITAGVPVLEELIGSEWPGPAVVDVVEASTGYLRGYAGYFDPVIGEIEAGEDLDEVTILHELAHGWFNSLGLEDRFLIEGIAEETAARALGRLGGGPADPLTDDEIRADWGELTTFPLLEWGELDEVETDDSSEDWGYAESHRLVRALWDEVGDERMTELLSAVADGTRAYPPETAPPDADGRNESVGWRGFLDLAEQLTGSTQLRDTYAAVVVGEGGPADELTARNELADRYQELRVRGGTWWPPAQVRDDLAEWRLDAAATGLDTADELLDLRDELCDALDVLDLTAPAAIETDYQGIDGPATADRVRDDLTELAASAEELAAGRSALEASLTPLEQTVPVLTQAEYESDPAGAVDTTDELLADASRLTVASTELDELLTGTDLAVPALAPTAFEDDPDAAVELVREQRDAAQAVLDAHRARDEARSLVERLGGYRSDIDREVERADRLLSIGDLDGAVAASRSAITAIDQLDDVGRARIWWSVGAGVAVVLLLVALVVIRRRRSAAVTGDGTNGTDGADEGAPTLAGAATSPVDPAAWSPPTVDPTHAWPTLRSPGSTLEPVAGSAAGSVAEEPVAGRVAGSVAEPVAGSAAGPVAEPVAGSAAPPVAGSVAAPVAGPAAPPVAGSAAGPVAEPVAGEPVAGEPPEDGDGGGATVGGDAAPGDATA